MDRRALLTGALGIGAGVALPAIVATTSDAATPFVTTDLHDAATQRQVAAVLRRAGIAPKRITPFLAHVRQFNEVIRPGEVVDGWRPGESAISYDPYALQDRWQAKHPTFPGYNCRITAYGLYGGHLHVDRLGRLDGRNLFLDHDAIAADRSALFNPGDPVRFDRVYSTVFGPRSTSPQRQLAAFQAEWRRRGIRFDRSQRVRLVSVVLHGHFERDELMVGHTGVLLPRGDGLWFVEKLAFQEPYRVTRFQTRRQLSDVLMRRYDDHSTDAAPPLVLENDRLIAGWRRLPAAGKPLAAA